MRSIPVRQRFLRHILAAVALVGLAGCARPVTSKRLGELGPRERASLFLTAADDSRGSQCSISLQPPPSPHELLDTTAVLAGIRSHARESGGGRGVVLISVMTDTAGAAEWIEVLETDLPVPLAESLAGSFAGHLKARSVAGESGPRRVPWNYRFRIEPGAEQVLRVGQAVNCRPELINRAAVDEAFQREVALHPELYERARVSHLMAVVYIWLDLEGRPERMEIGRSSGETAFDLLALRAGATAEFTPALMDGRPHKVVATIPIRLTPPDP
jgi:TonB family protein